MHSQCLTARLKSGLFTCRKEVPRRTILLMGKIKKIAGYILTAWAIIRFVPDTLESVKTTAKYGQWLYSHGNIPHSSLLSVAILVVGVALIFSDTIQRLLPKHDGLFAKVLRAHLIIRDPLVPLWDQEGRVHRHDFVSEIFIVNRSGMPVTIQKILGEAEVAGKWVSMTLVDDLEDFELEFPDETVDNPRWLGGSHSKRMKLEPNLAAELKTSALIKGIHKQGWLRFRIDTSSKNAESGIPIRVRFVDALDGVHVLNMADELPSDAKLVHSLGRRS